MDITVGQMCLEVMGKEALDRVLIYPELRTLPVDRVVAFHVACYPINEFEIKVIVVEYNVGQFRNIVFECDTCVEEVEAIAQRLNERLQVYRMVAM